MFDCLFRMLRGAFLVQKDKKKESFYLRKELEEKRDQLKVAVRQNIRASGGLERELRHGDLATPLVLAARIIARANLRKGGGDSDG